MKYFTACANRLGSANRTLNLLRLIPARIFPKCTLSFSSSMYYLSGWNRCPNSNAEVGNLLNQWATSSPNNVPAGRHHSSGPKKKGPRQNFRPFFGRIDGEDQKAKGFRQNFRSFFSRLLRDFF